MDAICPGELIHRELDARGWSEHDLARVMGQPVHCVRELMIGQRPITPDLAQRLSISLGMSPPLWLYLDATYRRALMVLG